MRRRSIPLAAAAALLLAPPAALAHSHRKKGVEVVHPWTAASPGAGGTTRVFMKIKNLAGTPDRLVGAFTDAAAKTELRQTDGDADKPVARVVVPPGKDALLTADGPHLRLTGLKRRLDAYDSFKLTLMFEKAGRMVVDVAIEESGETPHKH